jgi:putative ATP-dependent endonuclease of OLD family
VRVQHLVVEGFRSIRRLEMSCEPVVVLLGPNNHGKSNVLAALAFGLGCEKPQPADFCRLGPPVETMAVTMTMGDLSDAERQLWEPYLRADGALVLRRHASLADGKVGDSRLVAVIQEPKDSFLKAAQAPLLTTRADAEGTPLKDLLPKGKLSKDAIRQAQRQYIDTHRATLDWEEGFEEIGPKSAQAQNLPALHWIPAVRDAGEEAKTKSTTAFGQLLQLALGQMAVGDPKFSALRSRLEEVSRDLTTDGNASRPEALAVLETGLATELKSWDVKVSIDVRPTTIEKLLEMGSTLTLDDGVPTGPEGKGHGLQRALIFGLLRLVAKANATASPTRSAFFAIEEPELFLHPHAQRDLALAIRALAEPAGRQVFLCTHSTHFVDLDSYKDIVVITKGADGTGARQCKHDLFAGEDAEDRKQRFRMARWINPDRAEMFFADRVVFVEGDTEKTTLAYLAEKLGRSVRRVSVVDCGGKNNLRLYIGLAKAFSMDYRVVHDEDPIPPGVNRRQAGREREALRRQRCNRRTGRHGAGRPSIGRSSRFRGGRRGSEDSRGQEREASGGAGALRDSRGRPGSEASGRDRNRVFPELSLVDQTAWEAISADCGGGGPD